MGSSGNFGCSGGVAFDDLPLPISIHYNQQSPASLVNLPGRPYRHTPITAMHKNQEPQMRNSSFAALSSMVYIKLVVLECCLVRYGQLLATLCATCSQYLAAIGSSHSLTETVLVDSLATRRLVSSFHCHSRICFLLFLLFYSLFYATYARCKGTTFFRNCK